MSFLIVSGLLIILFCRQSLQFNDNKLHVVFCDVGQGDGIFIRAPGGQSILIDGGPNDKILNCLSQHMPFWDRTIELVILTHPHADHYTGLTAVLKRYTVKNFATEKEESSSLAYKELLQTLSSQKISVKYLHAHDRFKTKDGLALLILAAADNALPENKALAVQEAEKDVLSMLLTLGSFNTLLTSDSQEDILNSLLDSRLLSLGIDVLQVPHHGSRYGLGKEVAGKVKPNLAVISVGRNNKYGHPAESVLALLQNTKTLRTDKNGEIEIVTDGQSYTFKKGR